MAPNPTSQNTGTSHHDIHHIAPLKLRPTSLSNLYIEEERLLSFRNWPSNVMAPHELAANGFYFTGVDDIARCAFCGLEVGHWVEGDSASADHKRYSPDCDLVRGRPCGNVPKGAARPSSPSPSPPSYDTCGPYGHLIRPYSGPERTGGGLPPTLLQDLEQLGVSKTSGPVHQCYSTEDARLRTYTNWPASCPMRPEALAAAGFYSTGKDDHAVCFHCGGGLKDWEAGDDPWVEHARWFSRCAFVLMHKGRDFVVNVTQKNPALLSAETVNELLEQSGRSEDESIPSADCIKENLHAPEVTPRDAESNLRDMELCKICYARERAIVFLPCGHFVSCAMCASALSSCPVCRKPYEATVRAYLS